MKSFGHYRHDRNELGEIIYSKYSPAKARTQDKLGGAYGADSDKRLIVSLAAKDLIELRPEKTRRPLTIRAHDLYAQLVRAEAARIFAENRARKKKGGR